MSNRDGAIPWLNESLSLANVFKSLGELSFTRHYFIEAIPIRGSLLPSTGRKSLLNGLKFAHLGHLRFSIV